MSLKEPVVIEEKPNLSPVVIARRETKLDQKSGPLRKQTTISEANGEKHVNLGPKLEDMRTNMDL